MMKGFLKISKLMGLMLLASGLIFAGCGAPDGSSEDAVAGNGGFMIPITMDMASQTLKVGDGAGMATGTWDGHQVGLNNVGVCTNLDGDSTTASCAIRVTNLDPNYYMANTYIALSYCADCAGDKLFSNADLDNGLPVRAKYDNAGTGNIVDINGSAYCVVEDGRYNSSYTEPYNRTGCVTVRTKLHQKPLQFIHPDCGSRDVQWDFSTATGDNFRFYANIAAQWFHENPLGADNIPNTTDDDARFDFENRTSYYLTLNAIDDISTKVNKAWWRLGSYKRSTTLTGYGSGGADYTPPGYVAPVVGLSNQKYFALNVMAEYADRIEKYVGVGYSDASGLFSDYEYYSKFAWVIRYDPTVIGGVFTSGLSAAAKNGGIQLYAGALELCNRSASSAHCDKRKPTFTGLNAITPGNSSFDAIVEAQGYLFTYTSILIGPFEWNAGGDAYVSSNNGTIIGASAGIWPVHAGHVGLAKVNMIDNTATYIGNYYASTAMIASGTPDPEPEMNLAMYYFKLKPGQAGRGTQLYADQWAAESGVLVNWTNGTAAGGFNGSSSNDYTLPCIPLTPAYDNGLPTGPMGCAPAPAVPDDYFVYSAVENPNKGILHGGPIIPYGGNGAFQYWNVHLCVQ